MFCASFESNRLRKTVFGIIRRRLFIPVAPLACEILSLFGESIRSIVVLVRCAQSVKTVCASKIYTGFLSHEAVRRRCDNNNKLLNKKRILAFRLKDELMLYLRAACNLGVFVKDMRETHETSQSSAIVWHYSHVMLSILLNETSYINFIRLTIKLNVLVQSLLQATW